MNLLSQLLLSVMSLSASAADFQTPAVADLPGKVVWVDGPDMPPVLPGVPATVVPLDPPGVPVQPRNVDPFPGAARMMQPGVVTGVPAEVEVNGPEPFPKAQPVSQKIQLQPADPDFAPLAPREMLEIQPQIADSGPPPAPCIAATPLVVGRSHWPEVWGFGGIDGTYGSRMAPNGVAFDPLFDIHGQINIGLLPDKKVYFFCEMDFWGQKAGTNITNPNQGAFDYSKREWDFDLGIAWNYWNAMELRVSGYANNNLNRGTSLTYPYGYNDGVAIENRYYFNNADKYDVGKLSFVSIGYMPSSTLTGQDGIIFHAGMTARAYLTCDIPTIRSYVYFDGQYCSDGNLMPRLLKYDLGLAIRPFEHLQNLEFRLGGEGVYDCGNSIDRSLGYVGLRLQF